MLKSFLSRFALEKPVDQAFYSKVAEELGRNELNEGLWAKCLSEAEWDMSKAKSLYVKHRAKILAKEACSKEEEERFKKETITENLSEDDYKRIDFCRNHLNSNGYKVIPKGSHWLIKSPEGCNKIVYSIEEIEDYTQKEIFP